MRSKRITRQITKAFGPELAEEDLSANAPAEAAQADLLRQRLWENLPDFFATVDQMYAQLEEKATVAHRSLEISSEELGATNRQLFSLNQTFDAILNSLGQGFLLLGKDGLAQGIYSKACETLLETEPKGKALAEILRVPAEKVVNFQGWYELLFQELMDFEDLAPLGPKFYAHSAGNVVALEFKPVRDPGGMIEFVLMIATDLTKEVQATEKAKTVQAYANFVTSILQNKARFLNFVKEFRVRIAECQRLTRDSILAAKAHGELKSLLHGLKGGAGLFGIYQVEKKIHAAESLVVELQSEGRSVAELSVDLASIGETFETILSENREILGDLLQNTEPARQISVAELNGFGAFLAQHGNEELRRAFELKFVAEPAFTVMADFNADLKSTAKLLGKKLNPIVFEGDNIPILREAYGDLFSDMIHLFRNIVDHGIEAAPARRAAGKPPAGNVAVKIAKLSESTFEFSIQDDGAGINEARLAERLHARGIRPGNREELLDSIFGADVSTSERITEISGRGIGLFAVRARVNELGGKIWVTSQAGIGTVFHLRLPILSGGKR